MAFLKVLTFFIACIGVYIAFQQYQINRQKLKLDLFEKRYSIFNALKTLLFQIIREESVDHQHINEYKINIADAEFLFGTDVLKYLQEVLEKAAELRMHNINIRNCTDELARSGHIDREHQVILWFSEQLNRYQKPFIPYMGMKK